MNELDSTLPTLMVLNGPNLNLLGRREPAVYGAATLADVRGLCEQACALHGFRLDFRQSNHEGVLIDAIHEAGALGVAGVVLNAGAYTHTSVALHDAIRGAEVRVVELHLSNIHAREAFRHHSWIAPVAQGVIMGFGAAGYGLAIAALAGMRPPN
jgi:3-dehydroquinate dehydratase-2